MSRRTQGRDRGFLGGEHIHCAGHDRPVVACRPEAVRASPDAESSRHELLDDWWFDQARRVTTRDLIQVQFSAGFGRPDPNCDHRLSRIGQVEGEQLVFGERIRGLFHNVHEPGAQRAPFREGLSEVGRPTVDDTAWIRSGSRVQQYPARLNTLNLKNRSRVLRHCAPPARGDLTLPHSSTHLSVERSARNSSESDAPMWCSASARAVIRGSFVTALKEQIKTKSSRPGTWMKAFSALTTRDGAEKPVSAGSPGVRTPTAPATSMTSAPSVNARARR